METPSAAEQIRLSTRLGELPGVGVRRKEQLARLGLHTVSDLLRHLPLRHEHQFAEGSIADLPMEGIGSARGTIVAARMVRSPGGKGRFEATLQDHSERLALVWFNAGYLRDRLHPGLTIRVQGRVQAFHGYPQMTNPQWEPLAEPDAAPAKDERLRPVYPASEDLPSAVIEKLVEQVLDAVLPQVTDPLPEHLVRAHHLPALADAFRMAHRPQHPDEALQARRRLAFNELLLLQLGIVLKRHYNQTSLEAPALRWNAAIDQHIRQRFPFQLTLAQETVIAEIAEDLQRSRPMNRLLQGDVGAGKTVVALYALLLAVADKMQGAIMTPTELLAEQHFGSISRMLEGSTVRLELLTAGRSAPGSADRKASLARIDSGEADIVIGTQALLTESVRFSDLAVVVIDEQHRFGVLQRAAFRSRGHNSGGDSGDSGGDAEGKARRRSPHYLVMTATPIPRTLSLTVFGDLDISTIRGLPPGRSPIITRVVGQDKSDEVYRYIAQRVVGGEQAYVVVPTIDASGHESLKELKSVQEHAKLLQDKYLPEQRVEAIHGRLKAATREAIMQRFRDGHVQVLVATTVIEVGVDVPNATIMVVEHAERFGLAQLHQLRGRVGRGTGGKKSLCVFIAEPTTEEATQRMAAIGGTADGFAIAEADLQIRGMGDFFGTRQHGLPPLRVAKIPEDIPLLQMARRDADALVSTDPTLDREQHRSLRKVLVQQHGEALGLIDVG